MTQRYGPGPHLEQLDGYSQKGIVCWLTKAVCVCFSFSGYSIDYIELKRRLPALADTEVQKADTPRL